MRARLSVVAREASVWSRSLLKFELEVDGEGRDFPGLGWIWQPWKAWYIRRILVMWRPLFLSFIGHLKIDGTLKSYSLNGTWHLLSGFVKWSFPWSSDRSVVKMNNLGQPVTLPRTCLRSTFLPLSLQIWPLICFLLEISSIKCTPILNTKDHSSFLSTLWILSF